MRFINQKARKVASLLLNMAQQNGGSIKIDNTGGAFMPVHVQVLHETPWGIRFSVSHYYEQNGDLCPDPDMEFVRTKFGEEVLPINITQTFGTRRDMVEFGEDGKPKRFYPRGLRELASFAGVWMQNIKHQQRL